MGYTKKTSLLLAFISLGIVVVAAATDATKSTVAKDAPKIAKDPGFRRGGLSMIFSKKLTNFLLF